MSPAHSIDSLEEMRDGPRLRTLFFACKFGFYDKAVQQITASFNAAIKLHNLRLYSRLQYSQVYNTFDFVASEQSGKQIMELLIDITDLMTQQETEEIGDEISIRVLKLHSSRLFLIDTKEVKEKEEDTPFADEQYPLELRSYGSKKEWFSNVFPNVEMSRVITKEYLRRIMEATGTRLIEDLGQQKIFIAGDTQIQTTLAYEKLQNVAEFWTERVGEQQQERIANLFYPEQHSNFRVCWMLFPTVEKFSETTVYDPKFVRDLEKTYRDLSKAYTIRCCLLSPTRYLYCLDRPKEISPVVKECNKHRPSRIWAKFVFPKKGNWVAPSRSIFELDANAEEKPTDIIDELHVNIDGKSTISTDAPYPKVDISGWNMGVPFGADGMQGMTLLDTDGMQDMAPPGADDTQSTTPPVDYSHLSFQEQIDLVQKGQLGQYRNGSNNASSSKASKRSILDELPLTTPGDSSPAPHVGQAVLAPSHGSDKNNSSVLGQNRDSGHKKVNIILSNNTAIGAFKNDPNLFEDIYGADDVDEDRKNRRAQAISLAVPPATIILTQPALLPVSSSELDDTQISTNAYSKATPSSIHGSEPLSSIKQKSLEEDQSSVKSEEPNDLPSKPANFLIEQRTVPNDDVQKPAAVPKAETAQKPHATENPQKPLQVIGGPRKPATKIPDTKHSKRVAEEKKQAAEKQKQQQAINSSVDKSDPLYGWYMSPTPPKATPCDESAPLKKPSVDGVGQQKLVQNSRNSSIVAGGAQKAAENAQNSSVVAVGQQKLVQNSRNSSIVASGAQKAAENSQNSSVVAVVPQEAVEDSTSNVLVDFGNDELEDVGGPGNSNDLTGLVIEVVEVISGEHLDRMFGASLGVNNTDDNSSGSTNAAIIGDQVSSRDFHSTMNQMAPAIRLSEQLPEWDPSGDFLRDIELGLYSPFDLMKKYSGKVTLRAVLGRFVIGKNLTPQEVYSDTKMTSFNPPVLQSELATDCNIGFTKVITTISAEAQYVLDMVNEEGAKMWDPNSKVSRHVLYVFYCRDNKAGRSFEVIVNGVTHDFEVRSKPCTLGTINVHGVLRSWDYRVTAQGSESMGAEYHSWAAELVKWIGIPGNRTELEMTFRIVNSDIANADLHDIEVLGLRVHRESNHMSLAGDATLHIDNIEDVKLLRNVRPMDGGQTTLYWARSYDAEENPPKTFARNWFEFSVSSVQADKALKENLNLEIGEKAGWKYETLLEQGIIWSLCYPISQILKQGDGLGYYNVDARPDPEPVYRY